MAENTEILEIEQKSTRKWLIISLSTLLLFGSAGGVYWFTSDNATEVLSESTPTPNAETVSETDENLTPVFVELESFTVNLQPDGQFLQASFNLQVHDDETAKTINLYMPHIRSRILFLLSEKTADELVKQKGKTTLISEIKQLIEQPFAKGSAAIKITDVLITSFIIQ